MPEPARSTQHTATEAAPGEGRADPSVPCPAAWAIELVAHKWTIHIVFALHHAGSPTRFRELQRTVAPITHKELTKRLRDLERSGLVRRQVFAEVPPRVEYQLTKLGSTLIPALTGLNDWAERYGTAVIEHWRREGASAGSAGDDDWANGQVEVQPGRSS
jgi:DNA-binding HxlR family transcriptional regulator